MLKPFLLLAGSHYYPKAGIGDWIGRFDSHEEILSQIKTVEHSNFFRMGKRKGQVKEIWESYIINGREYDWYEIVNLEFHLI